MSKFDSTKNRLADLLRNIVEGKIQLPDFQRGWVWDDDHIRSLLTSIARAFPVGAVMLLETGGDAKFKIRPVEGIDPNAVTGDKAERLILDGQQRLTSLTQVLILNAPVQTRDHKGRELKRHYYIDIDRALQGPEHFEDAIFGVEEDRKIRENFGRDIKLDLSAPELEFAAFAFPCNQILNSDSWEQGLFNHSPNRFGAFMKFRGMILDEFRKYDIPVIELKKENRKEAVCLVFEKVNTGGVPLSVFELITATYAADGINLRDEWFGNVKEKVEGIRHSFSKHRMLRGIEPTDFFQGLSLLHTMELRKADIAAGKTGKQMTGVSAKREAVLALPLASYLQWKNALSKGFSQAAKFLRQESFFATADLPYRTQLVPLAVVLTLLGERWQEQKIYDKVARWYWCGVLGELYGGAVETRFALDVQEVMAWTDGGATEPTTITDANFQSSRLDTLRSRNSAAYKGINVLIQRNGARDFFWKSTIRDLDENDWEECKLDIHHIFPKAWCKEMSIGPKRFNSILNKTPISYKANRMIGGKAPSLYLAQLQGHKTVQLDDGEMNKVLETHFIHHTFLRADNFDGFIESRRAMLAEQICKAMGKAVSTESDAVSDEDGDDDEDEDAS
ncbi:hypothetical protein BURK2_00506 [Burkholderiales bacterium]|nr:MAG: DUF262 domain-containing protein [Burkholderiales bacterium]CAG0956694.1 hypothetical protein BURK2_00506 [Burkholderiales bacterium]